MTLQLLPGAEPISLWTWTRATPEATAHSEGTTRKAGFQPHSLQLGQAQGLQDFS